MSAFGEAFVALKNVVLMQERLDALRAGQGRIAEDLRGLNAYIISVDKRVLRLETMIEMSARPGGLPQIESQ